VASHSMECLSKKAQCAVKLKSVRIFLMKRELLVELGMIVDVVVGLFRLDDVVGVEKVNEVYVRDCVWQA
jgi:hypothetical protein